jgi:hypothetical protein
LEPESVPRVLKEVLENIVEGSVLMDIDDHNIEAVWPEIVLGTSEEMGLDGLGASVSVSVPGVLKEVIEKGVGCGVFDNIDDLDGVIVGPIWVLGDLKEDPEGFADGVVLVEVGCSGGGVARLEVVTWGILVLNEVLENNVNWEVENGGSFVWILGVDMYLKGNVVKGEVMALGGFVTGTRGKCIIPIPIIELKPGGLDKCVEE